MSDSHSASFFKDLNASTLSTLLNSFSILFLKTSGATHAQFIVQADQDMSSLRKVFASESIDRNLDRPSIRVGKDICPDDVLDAMLARARDDDEDTPRRYNSNFEH